MPDDDIAAEVRKLTKDDILKFYDTHLLPASTQRARISIHLVSQKKSEPVAKMSDDERLEKLSLALANHFKISNLPADQEQMKARFDGVEISSGNEEAISSSITDYLTHDAKLPEAAVQNFIVDGKAQLTPLLASVGVEPGTTSTEQVELQERTYITDLDELKRTLPKYPLLKSRDLSQFEDSELKL